MRVLSESPDRFAVGQNLIVEPPATDLTMLTVVSMRPHQGKLLIQFDGVSDRSQAENLRGILLFAKTPAPEPPEGSYWAHQLIGMEVFHVDGHRIGEVKDVLTRPGQDLWCVLTDDGEVLVPAVEPIVVSVSVDEMRIVIDPPQGLI